MKNKSGPLLIYLCFNVLLFSETQTSATVFYNYTRNLNDGNNAFNLKRGYLSFANDVSETVSYKITYDVGSNDAGSAYTAFLKVAMIKLKTKICDVSIGMQGMNMYKTTENTWGHRFIAKGSMGAYGFSPSADVGLGFTRSFGLVTTSALVTNGGGYKKPETDAHKKTSLHLVYGQPKLNNENGFNLGGSFSVEPYDINENKTETVNVMGLFGGYAGFGFRGGIELDTKKIDADIMGKILSLYGTYSISESLSILARYDQVDIDTSSSGDGIQAIILGLHYRLGQGIIVAPTLRTTTPENGESVNTFILNFEFNF